MNASYEAGNRAAAGKIVSHRFEGDTVLNPRRTNWLASAAPQTAIEVQRQRGVFAAQPP
jgi:hypothetical protein